jgi:peptidyl-prolyl cis-trans isomerase B (cyclophilin B)
MNRRNKQGIFGLIAFALLLVPALSQAQTTDDTTLSILPSERAVYDNIENNEYFSFNKFDPAFQLTPPVEGDSMMVIETNVGTMIVKLFPDKTPKTFARMKELIDSGFYDEQTDDNGNTTYIAFHRVISDFMIQTGDPLSRDSDPANDGTGGSDVTFEDEFDPELRNIRGALSMANSGVNTNDSQFFLNQVDRNMFLDFKHTVWGQTYAGLNIIDYVANLPKDATDERLLDKVYITNIDIIPYSEAVEAMVSEPGTGEVTQPTEESTQEEPAPTFKQSPWYSFLKVVFYALVAIIIVLIIILIIIRIKFGSIAGSQTSQLAKQSKKKRPKKQKQYGKTKHRRK